MSENGTTDSTPQSTPPNQSRHRAMAEMLAGAQQPARRIPERALQALLLAQAQAQVAEQRFLRMRAEIERDHGFRFDKVTVGPDGTITPDAVPPSPPEGAPV